MSQAEEQRAEALKRIRHAIETKATALDLRGLTGLTYLQALPNELGQLTTLQSLDVSWTQLSDLRPLATLIALQSLDVSVTQMSDLRPLSTLTALRSLDVSHTQVSDLGPLATLTALQSLDVSYTQVSDLRPFATLTALQSLVALGTQVSDLGPLATLTALQSFDLSKCGGGTALGALRFAPLESLLPQLEKLGLRDAIFADLPGAVYEGRENAVDAVRAFYADLRAGATKNRETKLILLGNGSAGKTQLCRRLRGDDFEETVPSTHGIEVHEAMIKLDELEDPVPLNIWDFGGQETYHGTHALFIQGRAVFAILWTPELEKAAAHPKPGTLLRDRPLIYWLDYVRFFAETKNPVILVQSKFDTWAGRVPKPPSGEADDFDLLRKVEASAKTKTGPDALREVLKVAIRDMLLLRPAIAIPASWNRVSNRLRGMLESRKECFRLLERAQFDRIYLEEGGLATTEKGKPRTDGLLQFLHERGAIFYDGELFNGSIVLDQNWALKAVYTVFERERTLPLLRDRMFGRFTRTLLHEQVWEDYTQDQQEVFLGLMESCGICFKAGHDLNGEQEYVAPELLPSQSGAQRKLINGRVPLDEPAAEAVATYPFLHEGILRNFLSRIGSHAGDAPQYWRYGCWFSEGTTRSTVLIEGGWTDAAAEAGPGTIRFRAWGARASDLIQPLLAELKALRLGHEPGIEWRGESRRHMSEPAKDREPGLERLVIKDQPKPAKVFVSYAWRDEQSPETAMTKLSVDALNAQIRKEGWSVVRDATDKPYGAVLNAFMNTLGASDIAIVLLSDRYLRSAPCMTELHLLWLRSVLEGDKFRRRIVAVAFSDAKPSTPKYWLDIDKHWATAHEEMRDSLAVLTPGEREVFGHIERWHGQVGAVLSWWRTFLQPLAFADVSQNEFGPLKELLERKCKELATESEQETLDRLLIEARIEMATPDFLRWAAGDQASPVERAFSGTGRALGSVGRAVSDRAELAIVFTDVVGSTALGQELGDAAMDAVRRAHFAKSQEFIRKFAGREVKTIGDSFMVAFHSPDNALAYARELQRDSGDPRLQVRAGIHVGPMTVEGEDVFGNAVNFAARVVSAAKGPEIWVSDAAKKKLGQPYKGLEWQPHEGLSLKGFEPEKFTLWSLPGS